MSFSSESQSKQALGHAAGQRWDRKPSLELTLDQKAERWTGSNFKYLKNINPVKTMFKPQIINPPTSSCRAPNLKTINSLSSENNAKSISKLMMSKMLARIRPLSLFLMTNCRPRITATPKNSGLKSNGGVYPARMAESIKYPSGNFISIALAFFIMRWFWFAKWFSTIDCTTLRKGIYFTIQPSWFESFLGWLVVLFLLSKVVFEWRPFLNCPSACCRLCSP